MTSKAMLQGERRRTERRAAIRRQLRRARWEAKRHGRPASLTYEEWAEKLAAGACGLCGRQQRRTRYAALYAIGYQDRERGLTAANCFPLCRRCSQRRVTP